MRLIFFMSRSLSLSRLIGIANPRRRRPATLSSDRFQPFPSIIPASHSIFPVSSRRAAAARSYCEILLFSGRFNRSYRRPGSLVLLFPLVGVYGLLWVSPATSSDGYWQPRRYLVSFSRVFVFCRFLPEQRTTSYSLFSLHFGKCSMLLVVLGG